MGSSWRKRRKWFQTQFHPGFQIKLLSFSLSCKFLDLFLSEAWPDSFLKHMGFFHVVREVGSGAPNSHPAGFLSPKWEIIFPPTTFKVVLGRALAALMSPHLPVCWATRDQHSTHSFTRTVQKGGSSKKGMLKKGHIYFTHSPLFFLLIVYWDAS